MSSKNTDENAKHHNTKISDAVLHVMWIAVISLTIGIIGNELFYGKSARIVFILAGITAYIIFSFARKYWSETKQKKIMEAIDITLTLLGGFTLMMLSKVAVSLTKTEMSRSNAIGFALAKNIIGDLESQPQVMVLYLGMLLLMIGVIRIYMMNKVQHRLKN